MNANKWQGKDKQSDKPKQIAKVVRLFSISAFGAGRRQRRFQSHGNRAAVHIDDVGHACTKTAFVVAGTEKRHNGLGENLLTSRIGHGGFGPIARFKLQSMLVLNKQQQNAIVGRGIANAPIVEQPCGEMLRFGLADRSQGHDKDISLIADGAQCRVDIHLSTVGQVSIGIADVDIVALKARVRHRLHRPRSLGERNHATKH